MKVEEVLLWRELERSTRHFGSMPNIEFISTSYCLMFLSKWFCDTSTGAAQEQPAVVLLWGMSLISLLLALAERGGHGDLRGSGRLSVISSIHGRTELYCAQICLA
jgi:hypothetical protein